MKIGNRLCDLSLNSILSRLKRSGNHIEGCGSTAESLPTRTLRYAIATQDANSHNPLGIDEGDRLCIAQEPPRPALRGYFQRSDSYPTMHYLQDLWNRYYIFILALLAFLAVFIWGVNVGRHFSADGAESASITLGTIQPQQTDISVTPTGEYIAEIGPAPKLDIVLDPAPVGAPPPIEPRLTVRVDIRDVMTNQPVRAEVWLTTVDAEESEDKLIRETTSLVEFELPSAEQAEEVYIKVQAPGYFLWSIGVRHQIEYDRVLPIPVLLERINGDGGTG